MKILCINVRKGIGDQIIFLPYLHAISKKFKVPISLLAKENSKAKELFSDDISINEAISNALFDCCYLHDTFTPSLLKGKNGTNKQCCINQNASTFSF